MMRWKSATEHFSRALRIVQRAAKQSNKAMIEAGA
jgi:hypothetical protein